VTRSLFAFSLPQSTAYVLAWDEAHARNILRRNFCDEKKHWADSPRIEVVA
jgi:hypothetical protein